MEPQSAPMEPVAAGDSNHPVDHLHTPDYVAGVLGLSVDRVRRLVATGALESFRLGHRSIRISDEQLERYLEARRTDGAVSA